MNYSEMKYTDLLKLCRDRNISGYSHKKKARLIELLEENDWICISSNHDKALTTGDIFKPYHDFYDILYKQHNRIYYKLFIINGLLTYRNLLIDEYDTNSIVLCFLFDTF